MKAKSGGGMTMSKNVTPGIRTGSASRGSSPAAAAQLGASVAFKREQCDIGQAYNSGVKLGNEKALDVGAGGPGKGRQTFRSGSQGQHGPVNQGESPRSEPRGFDSRGRLKGEV